VTEESDALLAPGTRVEVRMRLDTRHWHRGFEVIATDTDGYRLRRLSDGEELARPLDFADVRSERHRSQWWY
jgi:hypothetical protein